MRYPKMKLSARQISTAKPLENPISSQMVAGFICWLTPTVPDTGVLSTDMRERRNSFLLVFSLM
jgi:hypothetical protein